MSFVQNDHVVQAFTANTPDQPLTYGCCTDFVGDHDFLDPQMLYPLLKGRAIDAVPVTQEIPRASSHGKASDDLLGGPFRGGCSVTLKWTTRVDDGQDDQDTEQRVPHRGDHQEIRATGLHVIREKCLPRSVMAVAEAAPDISPPWIWPLDAQLAQLADDPWGTPGRIGLPHLDG